MFMCVLGDRKSFTVQFSLVCLPEYAQNMTSLHNRLRLTAPAFKGIQSVCFVFLQTYFSKKLYILKKYFANVATVTTGTATATCSKLT
jgi:hypothetical protein